MSVSTNVTNVMLTAADMHHHDLHAVREEAADNPSHPERLLKVNM